MFSNLFKKREIKKYILPYFCFDLVEHCNLNCKYCDHFSPLAKKSFTDLKKMEQDFLQISKYFNITSIGIMGGEPLLHPQINEALKIIRNIFPYTNLLIYTNGILLSSGGNQLKEDFYKTCNENNIAIIITRYPLNLDLTYASEMSKKYNVKIMWEETTRKEYRKMHKLALDITGSQNFKEMSKKCWLKCYCVYFKNGKFFQCTVSGNISKFNEYFNKNLEITNKDYLDIYNIKKEKEIENYFKNPIPFCKYCNFDKIQYDLPFSLSKMEIDEWT
jgi:organic radical activating enzyme